MLARAMPTPTFKLLLNALRLGQPQDPQASIRVLAEAMAAQDEVIEELKRKLLVVQSAAQIFETKAARLELELEAARLGVAMGPPALSQPYAPPAVGAPPASDRPPPPSVPPPMSSPAAERTPLPIMSSPLSPSAHGPSVMGPPATLGPSPGTLVGGATHRSPGSVLPPPRPPSEAPPAHPAAKTPPIPRPPSLPPVAPPPPTPMIEVNLDTEDSSDDFRVETVVVHKKDVEAMMRSEAPFRLAPPGQRVGPERGSIPGAPWARGAASPTSVREPMFDEFTLDAVHDHRDEGDDDEVDGETYRDAGDVASLAAALGLAPNDPRLEKIRALRESAAGQPSAEDPNAPRPRPRPKR